MTRRLRRRRILVFSEMRRMRDGWAGGYTAIAEGLARSLTNLQQEVKVLGVSYGGEEHDEPYAIIPLLSPEYAAVQLRDIINGWHPDVVMVCLDLPVHGDVLTDLRTDIDVFYTGVFPVEGEPVLPAWADIAAQMDRVFTLSEFGLRALRESGVRATLLPVGPTVGFGRAQREDLIEMRQRTQLGDRYCTLKVADNHGRKNWAHTIEYWARWAKPDCVLNAVTRINTDFGWDIGALLEEFGGEQVDGSETWRWPDGKEARVLSGLRRNDLAWVYNLTGYNGHLLMDTGNEGLSMPILEAFWVGVPVVGMAHTAIAELLADGRGITFPVGYTYRDVFGNVKRYFPDYDTWAAAMDQAYYHPEDRLQCVMNARAWVEQRSWSRAGEAYLGVLP